MATCEKILIAGFSGAGKSSLLKHLARNPHAGWSHFTDLDQLILKLHGRGYAQLSELIEAVGWEKFRLWERQTLEGWLKDEDRGVLALGGGTLSPLLWELYSKSSKLRFCHLNVSFATAWKRLLQDTQEDRPMVKAGEVKLQEIYNERKQLFSQIPWQLNGEDSLEKLTVEFWKGIP